jgi:DNA replication protein DnaC
VQTRGTSACLAQPSGSESDASGFPRSFKPLADFEWAWPAKCDRALIEELCSLAFITEAANVVFVGANGLGKTMLLKNLVHQAVLSGLSARFTLASDMLHDLAAQDSSIALARRLRRYTSPAVLAIDEVGYLSYDARAMPICSSGW